MTFDPQWGLVNPYDEWGKLTSTTQDDGFFLTSNVHNNFTVTLKLFSKWCSSVDDAVCEIYRFMGDFDGDQSFRMVINKLMMCYTVTVELIIYSMRFNYTYQHVL